MELVKEGQIDEPFTHNHSISIGLAAKRPSFTKAMGMSCNENRFALSDKYDKSTYLAKNCRQKQIIDFTTYSDRDK